MQRKEGFNRKMQENKPALELKNTEKKMCQKSNLKKKNSQCTLVSRPFYVKVDSPNLGFPYFNFLGGYQLKKHPVLCLSKFNLTNNTKQNKTHYKSNHYHFHHNQYKSKAHVMSAENSLMWFGIQEYIDGLMARIRNRFIGRDVSGTVYFRL